ncbi:MAG: heme ABC transporter ATP-binding protein [Pseudomonadota bacterium]
MTLTASDLHVNYGRRPILEGFEFEAEAGALTAIVGPNGSGKTTLMRALCGDLAARGQIRLNDFPVRGETPWALAGRRGVLPQATRVAFAFTVREVVAMGLEAGRHAADPRVIPRALEAVDMIWAADQRYQELSGGEQQRVQLARVLAQVWQPQMPDGPCWLFLDEPVASLDIAHQLTVMELARRYADEGGGVVAVMHDLNLTAMFADRVWLLKAGKVLATGSPVGVMTDRNLSEAYGCSLRVGVAPPAPTPFVLPQASGKEAS